MSYKRMESHANDKPEWLQRIERKSGAQDKEPERRDRKPHEGPQHVIIEQKVTRRREDDAR